jgi:hypothetical protein
MQGLPERASFKVHYCTGLYGLQSVLSARRSVDRSADKLT